MVLSKNVVNPCILLSLPFAVFPKATHLSGAQVHTPVRRKGHGASSLASKPSSYRERGLLPSPTSTAAGKSRGKC